MIGEILGTLEACGYLDNSVVVFASDHGDCLTDHGHSQKWTMYDTITRVPMLVWAPGRFDAGGEVDGLCQQMDIGPALLEMAGVEVDPALEQNRCCRRWQEMNGAGGTRSLPSTGAMGFCRRRNL